MSTDTVAPPMGGRLICGKAKHDGTPCKRRPGLGTPLDVGPCYQHTDASALTLEGKKKEIIRMLPDPHLTVSNISIAIDVPVSTIYEWARSDPEFRSEWMRVTEHKEEQRTHIIEESLFKRASDEKIQNPAESIFWLKNRAPSRWKDKVVQEVTGADGRTLMPIDALRSFLTEPEEPKALPKDCEIVIEETK